MDGIQSMCCHCLSRDSPRGDGMISLIGLILLDIALASPANHRLSPSKQPESSCCRSVISHQSSVDIIWVYESGNRDSNRVALGLFSVDRVN